MVTVFTICAPESLLNTDPDGVVKRLSYSVAALLRDFDLLICNLLFREF